MRELVYVAIENECYQVATRLLQYDIVDPNQTTPRRILLFPHLARMTFSNSEARETLMALVNHTKFNKNACLSISPNIVPILTLLGVLAYYGFHADVKQMLDDGCKQPDYDSFLPSKRDKDSPIMFALSKRGIYLYNPPPINYTLPRLQLDPTLTHNKVVTVFQLLNNIDQTKQKKALVYVSIKVSVAEVNDKRKEAIPEFQYFVAALRYLADPKAKSAVFPTVDRNTTRIKFDLQCLYLLLTHADSPYRLSKSLLEKVEEILPTIRALQEQIGYAKQIVEFMDSALRIEEDDGSELNVRNKPIELSW